MLQCIRKPNSAQSTSLCYPAVRANHGCFSNQARARQSLAAANDVCELRRKVRRLSAAVATSRAGPHQPRSDRADPHRRWEWALRRAHRELSWWSCEALLVSRDSKCTFQVPTRLGSGHCGLQGLPAREKAVGRWQNSAPRDSQNGIMEYGRSSRSV